MDDYKKSDSIEKCMKELKKGITNCTYKSGELVKEEATGEAGSVYYPNKESILEKPGLLEHGY